MHPGRATENVPISPTGPWVTMLALACTCGGTRSRKPRGRRRWHRQVGRLVRRVRPIVISRRCAFVRTGVEGPFVYWDLPLPQGAQRVGVIVHRGDDKARIAEIPASAGRGRGRRPIP